MQEETENELESSREKMLQKDNTIKTLEYEDLEIQEDLNNANLKIKDLEIEILE